MSHLTYGIWDKCPTWLKESEMNVPPDPRNLGWMPFPQTWSFPGCSYWAVWFQGSYWEHCFLGVPPVTYPGAVHEVLVVKLSICLLLTAPAAQGMPWGQKLTMDTSAAPTQEKFVGDSKPGFLALMQSYIKIQRGCFQGNLGNSNNNEQEQ